MTTDHINHPAHYTAGPIECIEALEAALSPEEFAGYCKGCALKYIWRNRRKGGADDLKKAVWYLSRVVERSALSEALLAAISVDVPSGEPSDCPAVGKPSWDEAPEWAQWLAQDRDGQWFWYSHEPVTSQNSWATQTGLRSEHAFVRDTKPSWHGTLEGRP